MGDQEPKPRKHPVPIPEWWIVEARAAMKARGLIQTQLAEPVWPIMGGEKPSQSQISRCFGGETTTVELVDAVSVVLGLPAPVAIASSRMEAIAIAQERLRYQLHMQVVQAESDTFGQEAKARIKAASTGTLPKRGKSRRNPE